MWSSRFLRISVIFESGEVVTYTRSAFRVITKRMAQLAGAGQRESDCTKHSTRLLRYVTVNGGRAPCGQDRVATVRLSTGPRGAIAVQRWHVAQDPRTYRRHAEIKRCVQWHTPLTIAKAARRVEAVTLRARRVVGTGGSNEKMPLVMIDDPGLVTRTRLSPLHLLRLSVNFHQICYFILGIIWKFF